MNSILCNLFFIVLFSCALVLPGCGGGGGGGGGGTTPTNSIAITTPTAGQNCTGNTTATITWTTSGTVGNLSLELSTDGGTNYSTLIASTPNDGSEVVTLPDTRNTNCVIRLTEAGTTVTDVSDIFTVWSNALPQAANVAISGDNGDIDITYDLVDADGDNCSLKVEYFDGTSWKSATVTGATSNVAPNLGMSLVWRSATDEPGTQIANCQIRITPTDTAEGAADTSASFAVDNRGFNDIGASLAGVARASVAWGDYDNDGDLDLAIAGDAGSENRTTIYENQNGAFSVTDQLTGVEYGTVAWGDYDSDGDLDLAVAGFTGGSRIAKVFKNDGGLFFDIAAPLLGVEDDIAWGDFDNDGDLDLAMCGNTGSGFGDIARIYRNNGGSFADIGAPLAGVNSGALAWGDYDNDGDLDLVLAGSSSGGIITAIYQNEDGAFSVAAQVTGVRYCDLAWGDYDNDGDLDLAVAGYTGSQYITKIYRNDDGAFSDIGAALTGVIQSALAWGDYDNDGDLDLVISGDQGAGSGVTKIYRNNGGTFTDIGASLTGVRMGAFAWGDYDNDGDLDLAMAGYTGSQYITKIYRNNVASANSIPEQATNLQSYLLFETGGTKGFLFLWDAARDLETPPLGLSYQLRIGTTQGGSEVFPGHHLPNGQRLLPQRAPIQPSGPDGTYRVVSLPTGTYYWTVQTVDSGFEGSSVINTAIVTVP